VQFRAGVTRELGHASLDRGVDVLVFAREHEGALVELHLGAVERGDDERGLVDGEQADVREHLDVRARGRDVVAREPAVERQALGEREQVVSGSLAEAPVPERHRSSGPPCSRAHVSTERPHRRTKPSESW
jgi:hypothetical protein